MLDGRNGCAIISATGGKETAVTVSWGRTPFEACGVSPDPPMCSVQVQHVDEYHPSHPTTTAAPEPTAGTISNPLSRLGLGGGRSAGGRGHGAGSSEQFRCVTHCLSVCVCVCGIGASFKAHTLIPVCVCCVCERVCVRLSSKLSHHVSYPHNCVR